jgi:hypothetical protein
VTGSCFEAIPPGTLYLWSADILWLEDCFHLHFTNFTKFNWHVIFLLFPKNCISMSSFYKEKDTRLIVKSVHSLKEE